MNTPEKEVLLSFLRGSIISNYAIILFIAILEHSFALFKDITMLLLSVMPIIIYAQVRSFLRDIEKHTTVFFNKP